MVESLKLRQEFARALEGYQPSESAKKILHRIPLVIFQGVSGAGRNTVINHLVQTDKYHFIVSDTTRQPKFRNGQYEEDGVHYHFRSEEDILEDLKKGEFLEAELIHNQQVSGISIRELERAAEGGKIPINEVEYKGALNIAKAKPDAKIFFIIPPSHKEWIYRLRGREVMSDQEFTNRMITAENVIKTGLSRSDYIFVINDSSHATAEFVDAIVSGNSDTYDDAPARQVAGDILEKIISSTH